MSDTARPEARAAVLGSGTMGAQIAVSLALGGYAVSLWGRNGQSLKDAEQRMETAVSYISEVGLVNADDAAAALSRISSTTVLATAMERARFAVESIVEDLNTKQELLVRAEEASEPTALLTSTTSALSPSDLQRPLSRPGQFAVAHYAQPAQLVKLVEVVPGRDTAPETTQSVVDILSATGKRPVVCPDVPGFLWARIQHAVLRELVTLVDKGLVSPGDCDTVLKHGYGVRLPAMGSFEHADLAGLDLIDSDASRAVWADLSNVTSPEETSIARLRSEGRLGMKTGSGFYDWTQRDAEQFKRDRDDEIVRRTMIEAGGRVLMK